VAHCPMPLMTNLLVVAPGALWKAGQVMNFGGQNHGHVFPDESVKALGSVLVPGALRLYRSEGLNPLIDRDRCGDQYGVLRKEVPPGPGIVMRPNRTAVGEGMVREGGLQEGGAHMSRKGRGGQRKDACAKIGLRRGCMPSSLGVLPSGRIVTSALC